jgi:transposase, IS605 orfB family
MRITSSYGMKLMGDLAALESSIAIYRQALSYIIPIINDAWEVLSECEYTNQKYSMVEKWIHSTAKNQARFAFDTQFPKLPSYLRRSAIASALGIVSSYRSNLENWEKEPIGHAPRLSLKCYNYPAYYKSGLFRNFDLIRQTIELKVFKHGDWVYEVYQLKTSDCNYYQNHLKGKKQNVPVITKKGRRFYATFSYEEETVLVPEESIRKVCAVDLGLGTDATCCIMGADGTVYARKFIHFSEEHDRLDTQLGRIKRNQKRGSRHNKTLWRKVSGLNQDIADKTVKAILDFGNEHGVDVFVLEYLEFKGKKAVKRAHFWRYKRIYKVLSQKAHQYGLRIARVNASNTSRLAFDGSGWSQRGKEITPKTPYAIMRFTTGKFYNADLNAAYNIGARYFIRHLLKTVTVTQRLALEAKVPQVAKRSTCTLSHLINLRSELVVLTARTQA